MPQSVFEGVRRIVAVGDLHGNYEGFLRILGSAGIIDKRGDWAARDTFLVQTGDVMGRGGDPAKILRLLLHLEMQAPRWNGQVQMLLGNHEIMSMHGLNSHTKPKEHAHFVSQWLEGRNWSPVPDEGFELPQGIEGRSLASRMALDWHRFCELMGPKGEVGRWLSEKNAAIKINGFLFVHGGLNERYGLQSLDRLNRQMRQEARLDLSNWNIRRESPLFQEDAPHWNREYTLRRSEAAQAGLQRVLEYHDCKAKIVGHTPTFLMDRNRQGRVLSLFGGRLFCIDTGIGQAYGKRLGALVIEGDSVRPLYPARQNQTSDQSQDASSPV